MTRTVELRGLTGQSQHSLLISGIWNKHVIDLGLLGETQEVDAMHLARDALKRVPM